MYEQVCNGLSGDVLEIGSGTGTFSEKIIHNSSPNSHIVFTDISTHYIKELEDRFLKMNYTDHGTKNISVYKLDLNCKEDYELIGYGKFDSIIAINVLEHVKDDEFALQQL